MTRVTTASAWVAPPGACVLAALLLASLPACSDSEEAPKLVFVDTSKGVRGILDERARAAREAGWKPRADGRLQLEPMTEDAVNVFFGGVKEKSTRKVYDPDTYYFARPNMRVKQSFAEHPAGAFRVITNSLGLREDEEVAEEQPDLRILVTGDSHTDGMCENSESFPNRLEVLLQENDAQRTVEVLNAGRGSFGFHNYLGVYQKFRYLKPDVFIVGVYLGNDFAGDLKLAAWHGRFPLPPFTPKMLEEQPKAIDESAYAYGQAFLQMHWFRHRPQAIPLASASAQRVMRELALRCEEDGVELVVLYIPAATDVEWDLHRVKFDRMVDICGLDENSLRVPWRLADELEQSLDGVPLVDGRDVLDAADGPHFWRTDKHINIKGHLRLAQALEPVVEAALAN